jgi:hypothetical protein
MTYKQILSRFYDCLHFQKYVGGVFVCTEGDIETNGTGGTEGGFAVLLNAGNETSQL